MHQRRALKITAGHTNVTPFLCNQLRIRQSDALPRHVQTNQRRIETLFPQPKSTIFPWFKVKPASSTRWRHWLRIIAESEILNRRQISGYFRQFSINKSDRSSRPPHLPRKPQISLLVLHRGKNHQRFSCRTVQHTLHWPEWRQIFHYWDTQRESDSFS
jgi:hypothetical protein